MINLSDTNIEFKLLCSFCINDATGEVPGDLRDGSVPDDTMMVPICEDCLDRVRYDENGFLTDQWTDV